MTAVLGDPPTLIQPTTAATAVPVFEWAEPAGAPAPFVYRVSYGQEGGTSGGWSFEYLPSSVTRAQHNGDPLQVGGMYSWRVELIDVDGNRTVSTARFTVE